ncbi:MAG: MFS transporter [Candidatus Eisenbacteria bacterium]|nr:MFS transporter [Candidatus Eisenbacteria bacterium]
MGFEDIQDPGKLLEAAERRPAVLRNRNFLLLWIGQLVSQVGDRIHAIALMWWVLETTGSAALMGTVLIFATIPSVVFGPFAGGYVDRWNRKVVIVAMDFVRGAIILGIAVMAIRGTLEVWQILVATAGVSLASVLFGPAVNATIPNLVRPSEITRANSLSQMVTQGTGIAGPALGGVLVAVWGVGGVFLLNGFSYVASALSELFIQVPETVRKEQGRRRILSDVVDGYRFVRENATIFGFLRIAAILNFFTAPFAILLPLITKEVLGRGAESLGVMTAAFSVGFLLASAVLAVLKERRRKHPWIILGIALAGVAMVLMGVFIDFTSYLALIGTVGVTLGVANILIMSYIQGVVPDDKRGRVFGFMMTLSGGLQPLAFAVFGLVADHVPIPYILWTAGAALFIGGLSLYAVPGMREI